MIINFGHLLKFDVWICQHIAIRFLLSIVLYFYIAYFVLAVYFRIAVCQSWSRLVSELDKVLLNGTIAFVYYFINSSSRGYVKCRFITFRFILVI